MAKQWILARQEGFESSLEFQSNVKVPSADELGPAEVLVKIFAASLNYRELSIATPGGINGPITPPIIPACDGAGIVEAVGSAVREFRPGDRVVTYPAPKLVESQGDDAHSSMLDVPFMLGQGIDGTLRSKGVFLEKALVHAPTSVGWLQAATLPCTWLTGWNALFGAKGQEAGADSWILVQGTAGLSIAVLQLAVAIGATVVATTSSEEKATRLKTLGAKHTVNYRSNPDGWGKEARELTPGGRGFDFVIDIGGNQTIPNSLAAVRVDGVVLILGGVGDDAQPVPIFAALLYCCKIRGFLAGSRNQLREVARFIDEKGIKPAIDDVVFDLEKTKDAYRYLKEKKHFSKVVISIDH